MKYVDKNIAYVSAERSGNGSERAENGVSGSGVVSGHPRKRLSGRGAWSGRPRSGSREQLPQK